MKIAFQCSESFYCLNKRDNFGLHDTNILDKKKNHLLKKKVNCIAGAYGTAGTGGVAVVVVFITNVWLLVHKQHFSIVFGHDTTLSFPR